VSTRKFKIGICPECKVRENDSSRKKLFKCKYCGEWFCKKHLEPKLAVMREIIEEIKDPILKDKVYKEWRKPNGHPDWFWTRKYFEELKLKEEERRRKIFKALDVLKKKEVKRPQIIIKPKLPKFKAQIKAPLKSRSSKIKESLPVKSSMPKHIDKIKEFLGGISRRIQFSPYRFIKHTLITLIILTVLHFILTGKFNIFFILLRSVSLVFIAYIISFIYDKTKYIVPWKWVIFALFLISALTLYSTKDYSMLDNFLCKLTGIESFSERIFIYFNSSLPIAVNLTKSTIGVGGVLIKEVTTEIGRTTLCPVVTIHYDYTTSEKSSKEAINYLNQIRAQYERAPLKWDKRVYELALARAKDMIDYQYQDHTNPYTGECPDNMKQKFNISSYEFVAENVYGYSKFEEGICTRVEKRSPKEAIDSWLESRGHRYNLLYFGHKAGAVACWKSICVFLGLNYDGFGRGCHTAKEGMEFWKKAPIQPGEV